MDHTLSDIFEKKRTSSESRTMRRALFVVMNASMPALPPSRHVLDDVEVVSFVRGPRSATRDRSGGVSRLVLKIPDPHMSSDHGRLLKVRGHWLFEDHNSKNGAVIAGRSSRSGMVEVGDILELGHTSFLLDTPTLGDTPPDTLLTPDPAHRELASFHPDLVAADEAIRVIAMSDVPLLLHGETGTGKEVYARILHELSHRPGPLIAVNCGALSASLLEAELFGHRKGAFSGATADRPGFVRSAHKGTLFLDEIGELPHSAQVALLRVLQEREVVPVGDSQPIPVDIRVCAASHEPLAKAVEAERFRTDLYARLLGHEIRLPPLRERPFDIGHLTASLLLRLAPERNVSFSPPAARALVAYDWPRNIRELERCLATAIVFARDQPIDLHHLPEPVRAAAERGRLAKRGPTEAAPSVPPPRSLVEALGDAVDDPLRSQLAAKLVEHRGNVSAVARDMGKHREQIQRWIKRFGFDLDLFRR